MWGDHECIMNAHTEVMKGSEQENVDYCAKGESRKPGGEHRLVSSLKPKKTLPVKEVWVPTEEELKPWQRDAEKLLLEQDSRKFLWIFDDGNTGKTTFMRYLDETYGSVATVRGSAADVNKMLDGTSPKLVIWNLPREQGNMISWKAIEDLKDGWIYCTKYESNVKKLKWHPMILVLANIAPPMDKLTSDRYVVKEVHEDELRDPVAEMFRA